MTREQRESRAVRRLIAGVRRQPRVDIDLHDRDGNLHSPGLFTLHYGKRHRAEAMPPPKPLPVRR